MPKTISENITDILRSGQVPSGDAVAMAMEEVKRKAVGGEVTGAKRDSGKAAPKPGLIHSDVPGRTDEHPTDVPEGSYVFPADVVSALGEGNTMAGASLLNDLFQIKKASGGAVESAGGSVPIIVAGGEYLLPPGKVTEVGAGDISVGHKRLDDFVRVVRKEHIKTLRGLPGPKK